jgi:hypothetical protein
MGQPLQIFAFVSIGEEMEEKWDTTSAVHRL